MSRMSRVLETYYTSEHVSVCLDVRPDWVLARIKDGTFLNPHFKPLYEGEQDISVVRIGRQWRIAGSAVNRYLQQHVFTGVDPIRARNAGELRRKVAALEKEQGRP